MNRKTNTLSNLKKQVLTLKSQLESLEKSKNQASKIDNREHSRSVSHSSRFNTITFDSTYLDRGVKKFILEETRFKNIVDVICHKSVAEKWPKVSVYRQVEYEKTKENFSTEPKVFSPHRSNTPNPLTGFGYSSPKKGIKTIFPRC